MHVLLISILITVTGQGQAGAAPDMATEYFTVDTNSHNATQAASENNARYNALLVRLKQLGVNNSDVHTTSYNIRYSPPAEPQNGAPVAPVQEPYGYFVSRGVQVTLHDVGSIGKAIDAALAAGVTGIGGVSFGVRETRPLFGRALGLAVADARSQAEAMAAAAGLHIVRIRSMQQGYQGPPAPMAAMQGGAMMRAVPTQIEPSSVDVSASVTIVYEAQ